MVVSLPRCTAVWLTTTLACLVVGGWASAEVQGWSSVDIALRTVAALALITCAVWAWWVTTAVVVAAVWHRPPVRTGWAQRLVLAACGAALVGGGQVGAAMATPGHIVVGDDRTAPVAGAGALEGLALPGRTSGPLVGRPDRTAPSPLSSPSSSPLSSPPPITVRDGDSLWVIAERLLAPGVGTAEVGDLVHRLHELNRDVIGSDPDLIFPGHQLRAPLGERPAR